MRSSCSLLLLAGFLFSGCKQEQPASSTPNASSSGNPITAPVDYLGAVGKAKQSADKTVSSASLVQAVKMFSAEEGRLPKTLQELVPAYIQKIPAPPAGMKYHYDPQTGVIKVVPQ